MKKTTIIMMGVAIIVVLGTELDGGNVTSKKIAKAACVQPLCNLRVNF